MKSGTKLILAIGVILIILAAAFAYYQKNANEVVAPELSNRELSARQIEPPKASASPDAAVDAAIQGLSAEADFIAGEDKDSSLIGADSQAINNFGQSYDEKEF